MESLIKKSAVKRICHQNRFRISSQNLEALEKELSGLVKERLERVMRSAKIQGRKNIAPGNWLNLNS